MKPLRPRNSRLLPPSKWPKTGESKGASSRRPVSGVRSWLVAVAVLGALGFGHSAALWQGINFGTSSIDISGIGRLYRVALPSGVRRLEDVRQIEISIPRADDYVRAYFNNYLVINNDDTTGSPLFSNVWSGTSQDYWKPDIPAGQRINRNGLLIGRLSINAYLRRGWNHLIIELENGPKGYCVVGAEFFVNGKAISGIPPVLPESPSTALVFVSSRIDQRSDRSKASTATSLDAAMCARVMYQFFLD
ncbi:hypothetical protein LJR161_004340 [Variovorax paradoxus]|uniref:Uncharacterized protein n=1 Tax=Variovorax paradoxus TaxID=34073 RepID=A0AAW8EQY1_VARPD|nr:hypothetical protein [Variovorax paradoxus]MDP9975267.1 hypothetical protein [Variovorax paradoxus]